MATLGAPTLTITIKKAADTVVYRLKQGIVAMIVRDATATAGLYVLGDVADMPSGLGTDVADSVRRAFLGGVNRPQKVLLSVIGSEADLVTAGAAALASSDFDYLACPDDVDSTEMEEITDWLDDVRSKYCIGKLVLPEHAADNMAVVNFSASGIKVGAKTYTGAQYCSRIAGLLAGTPLSNSATSAPLDEVEGVTAVADPDAAVAAWSPCPPTSRRRSRRSRSWRRWISSAGSPRSSSRISTWARATATTTRWCWWPPSRTSSPPWRPRA